MLCGDTTGAEEILSSTLSEDLQLLLALYKINPTAFTSAECNGLYSYAKLFPIISPSNELEIYLAPKDYTWEHYILINAFNLPLAVVHINFLYHRYGHQITAAIIQQLINSPRLSKKVSTPETLSSG